MRLRSISLFLALAVGLAAPGGAPAAPDALPASAYISGVVGHKQSLPLSCESRSAADLAAFWGIAINEVSFFNSLPKSDNPDRGFVGDVYGAWGQVPPNPYGVHAKPVARRLREYGLNAQAHTGLSWKDLRTEIAEGRPVIVWVIGTVWGGTPISYTASDGHSTTVAAYEHTMILIGYDETYVYLVDSGSGNTQTHNIGNFRASWAVLGDMAVTAAGPPAAAPSGGSTASGSSGGNASSGSGGGTYIVRSGDYLTKLAAQFGTTWQQLAAINGINWPYTIYAGQVLKTGQSGDAPQPTPKPTQIAPSNNAGNGAAASGATYIVKAGEHLMKIARALGLDWTEIAALNGLTAPYILYPGQVLKLPGGDALGSPPGDGEAGQPGPPLTGQTYLVQPGDYLSALGRKFGIPWTDIAAANGITWPYTLYPGQMLNIP